MIYYLAHPYSYNPVESFRDACYWTSLLREKGLIVFSPILHTHAYDLDIELTNHKKDEDYVAWDLALLEGFMNHDGFKVGCNDDHCNACRYGSGCEASRSTEIRYDLGIVVLMSKTAYQGTLDLSLKSLAEHDKVVWRSDGCRQEFEFAKKHHIRVLELEAFLVGEEKEL